MKIIALQIWVTGLWLTMQLCNVSTERHDYKSDVWKKKKTNGQTNKQTMSEWLI